MPRIVAISDSHDLNLTTKWNLPPGDILIHAGDMTAKGSIESFRTFGHRLAKLPYRYKIVIGGNHDRGLVRNPEATKAELYPYCIYLEDDLVEIMGLRIYGMPWMPMSLDINEDSRSFNLENTYEAIEKIPDFLDVLITHCPPGGVRDEVIDVIHPFSGDAYEESRHIGDPTLMSWYYKFREDPDLPAPRYHIFGHNHEGHGHRYASMLDTHFYNVALVNDQYKPEYEATVIDI